MAVLKGGSYVGGDFIVAGNIISKNFNGTHSGTSSGSNTGDDDLSDLITHGEGHSIFVDVSGDTMTGDLYVNKSTASSNTTTGAIHTAGGLGVVGAANIGGILTITNTTVSSSTGTGSGVFNGGLGVVGAGNFGGAIKTTNTTASSSTSTGSGIFNGGLGVAGAGNFGGAIKINDTTASINTLTGSLITAGGAGIAGALHVGGTGSFTGRLTVFQLASTDHVYIATDKMLYFDYGATSSYSIHKNGTALYYDAVGDHIFNNAIQATTGKFTNLTDGYLPYHSNDSAGLSNSALYTTSGNIFVGFTADPTAGNKFAVNGNTYLSGTTVISGTTYSKGNINIGKEKMNWNDGKEGIILSANGGIELSASGTGGIIDFHYDKSTADYTSRVIEYGSGLLSVMCNQGFYIGSSYKTTQSEKLYVDGNTYSNGNISTNGSVTATATGGFHYGTNAYTMYNATTKSIDFIFN